MEMYGWNGLTGCLSNKYYLPLAYMEATKGITKALAYSKQTLNILKKKQLYVHKIGLLVKEYINVKSLHWNNRENKSTINKRVQLGRMILCKYVLEGDNENVGSRHLANFFNNKNQCSPENPRYWNEVFTKELLVNNQYRKIWVDFLSFINLKEVV